MHYMSIGSRYQKQFHRSLSLEERQLGQQKIPQLSLHTIDESSWQQFYYSYNNQSLITLQGWNMGHLITSFANSGQSLILALLLVRMEMDMAMDYYWEAERVESIGSQL